MRIKITEQDIRNHETLSNDVWCQRLVVREMDRRTAFWSGLSEKVEQTFNEVIRPVHRHPQTLPHEWAQPFDPANTPLAEHESSCSEARPMALVMDFERDGRRKLVIQ